jgi:hypothetical protein
MFRSFEDWNQSENEGKKIIHDDSSNNSQCTSNIKY